MPSALYAHCTHIMKAVLLNQFLFHGSFSDETAGRPVIKCIRPAAHRTSFKGFIPFLFHGFPGMHPVAVDCSAYRAFTAFPGKASGRTGKLVPFMRLETASRTGSKTPVPFKDVVNLSDFSASSASLLAYPGNACKVMGLPCYPAFFASFFTGAGHRLPLMRCLCIDFPAA